MSPSASAKEDDKAAKTKEKKRPGEWKKNLALIAASIAISLLILEIFVRLTYSAQWVVPRDAIQPAGVFCCRMRADTTVTIHVVDGASAETTMNARGFRGPLVSSLADKPLRVVSIGDSLTFGWGLPYDDLAMTRFMVDYKKRHPDRDIGHAYAASPGWDPKDYYFAFMTEVLPSLSRVDLVVLGFFSGNDVLPPDTPRILDPKDAPVQTVLPEPIPKPWLRFPEWLRVQASGNLLLTRIGIAAGMRSPAFGRFEKDIDAQRPAWETTFFYVKALQDAVKRSGGRLVILSYPSLVQVSAFKSLDNNGLDHTAPDRMLERFCKENGIDLITPLETLKAHNQKNDLYWPIDRHMTAHGHEILASVLAERLGPIVDQAWEERARAVNRP